MTLRHFAVAVAVATVAATAPLTSQAQTTSVVRNTLVSNLPGAATTQDKNLQNPWGIANAPGGGVWVSDNASGLSTIYTGTGTVIPLVVTIPTASGQGVGSPTGIVWNPDVGKFQFSESGATVSAAFIFDSEDGTISAWAPVPGAAPPKSATMVIDNSTTGAVYKGLALGTNASGVYLFATNFHAGTVEAYDSTFKPATLAGRFIDKQMPNGFAPFGIQNIDGDLFVTYAKQNPKKHDDVAGPGLGYVDVFSTEGILLRRFAAGGPLNAPWGVVRAPFGFGPYAGQILVGNFGDGWINAFPPAGGVSTGALNDKSGYPLVIHGLWSLVAGSGAASNPDVLYYTAGPNGEVNGDFGSLTAKVGGSTAAPGGTGWP